MEPSGLALRLCEVNPSDFKEVKSDDGSSDIHFGSIVTTKWHSEIPNLIGLLYSSGVLRIWDVTDDVYTNYCLYVPSGSVYESDSYSRSLSGITHFDFLGRSDGTSRNKDDSKRDISVVFSMAHTTWTYYATLPVSQPSTAKLGTKYFGSIVYECGPQLKSIITSVKSWNVYANGNGMDAVCVGCEDGSVHLWCQGLSLAPATVVSTRNFVPDSSPYFQYIGSVSHDDLETSSLKVESDHDRNISAISFRKRHRIRNIAHLSLPSTPLFTASNNIFVTSSDNGSAKVWVIEPTTEDTESNNPLRLRHLSNLPVSSESIVSLSVSPFPESVPAGNVFDAARMNEWLGPSNVSLTPLLADSKSHLLTIGTTEGSVNVFRISIPSILRDLTDRFAHVKSILKRVNREKSLLLKNSSSTSTIVTDEMRFLAPSSRLISSLALPTLEPVLSIASSSISPINRSSQVSSLPTVVTFAIMISVASGHLHTFTLEFPELSSGEKGGWVALDDPVSTHWGALDSSGKKYPAFGALSVDSSSGSAVEGSNPIGSVGSTAATLWRTNCALDKLQGDSVNAFLLSSFASNESSEIGSAISGKNIIKGPRGMQGIGVNEYLTTHLTQSAVSSWLNNFVSVAFQHSCGISSNRALKNAVDEVEHMLGLSASSGDINESELDICVGALVACTAAGTVTLWPRVALPGLPVTAKALNLLQNISTNINNTSHGDILESEEVEGNDDLMKCQSFSQNGRSVSFAGEETLEYDPSSYNSGGEEENNEEEVFSAKPLLAGGSPGDSSRNSKRSSGPREVSGPLPGPLRGTQSSSLHNSEIIGSEKDLASSLRKDFYVPQQQIESPMIKARRSVVRERARDVAAQFFRESHAPSSTSLVTSSDPVTKKSTADGVESRLFQELSEITLQPLRKELQQLQEQPLNQGSGNPVCGVSKTGAKPVIGDRFRNPVRVAHALRADAALAARATQLLQAEIYSGASPTRLSPDGGDSNVFPKYPGIDSFTNEGIAPALGSSAAIALEIMRLEALTFDEHAAVEEILLREKVNDKVIKQSLYDRIDNNLSIASTGRAPSRTAPPAKENEANNTHIDSSTGLVVSDPNVSLKSTHSSKLRGSKLTEVMNIDPEEVVYDVALLKVPADLGPSDPIAVYNGNRPFSAYASSTLNASSNSILVGGTSSSSLTHATGRNSTMKQRTQRRRDRSLSMVRSARAEEAELAGYQKSVSNADVLSFKNVLRGGSPSKDVPLNPSKQGTWNKQGNSGSKGARGHSLSPGKRQPTTGPIVSHAAMDGRNDRSVKQPTSSVPAHMFDLF